MKQKLSIGLFLILLTFVAADLTESYFALAGKEDSSVLYVRSHGKEPVGQAALDSFDYDAAAGVGDPWD